MEQAEKEMLNEIKHRNYTIMDYLIKIEVLVDLVEKKNKIIEEKNKRIEQLKNENQVLNEALFEEKGDY